VGWWVNQSQTRRHELDAGYLWSDAPELEAAQPGEVVYVHSGGRIGMLGLVAGKAFPARQAAPGGRRLPVHFEELLQPLRPKDHLAAFKSLLPAQHSPLRASGDANSTVYLTRIDERVAALLRRLLGGQVEELMLMAPTLRSAERADDVAEHALRARLGLDAGTRKRLLAARRGLGVYRENVERCEQACRLSGLLDRRHLRARHIKPWRDCNDREKLDGSNGLLLSPHFDQLFERGLISFEDDGELKVARHLNPAVLLAWGVALPRNVGAFTPGQCYYLAYHRLKVFEQPAGGRRALGP
jgi:putative restriction endonuclease